MISYLKYMENNLLEAKKAKDALPKSIFETYSAFANTDGGIILLGVSEDINKNLSVTGVENISKVLDELYSSLNNKQKVSINILSDDDIKIKNEHGLEYIEINIPRATNANRPVYLNDNIKNSFKRNHSGDYRCSGDEIKSMVRDQVSDLDSKVLVDFSIDDLDINSIRRYRNMFKQLKNDHVWNSLEDVEFLDRIRALKIIDGIPKLTVAGLLFFGYDHKIAYLFPLYFLDYQEKMTDNSDIRYTDRIYTGTGDWSGNIFDFYFRVVGRLLLDIELPFKLQENSIHRISETNMHKAVREGLTNCLVNADFTFARGLVIKKTYRDITFENPGSLRVGVDQAFKGGISDPRNSNILHMFNQINVGEKAGSGIPTIKKAFEESNFLEPTLYDEFNPNRTFLKLSFVKKIKVDIDANVHLKANIKFETYQLSEQENKIVEYLKTNNYITRKRVETLIDVGSSRANLILKKLVNKKILVKKGSTRSVKYMIE